ncbi:ADP-ribosylation factor-like protein 13B [Neodiprion fabricii]|uniref:ADP-ribosylation factor-like protein 13B n=1 Tax=Neodiprion fabricii TaxID=2872261 RepID=UPI001ED90347|nr:ADP-ribosylation factor-like protein 13B [Neodiprion fabricii]
MHGTAHVKFILSKQKTSLNKLHGNEVVDATNKGDQSNMGNCIRAVLRKFRRKPRNEKNIVILFVGLDGAGKSLILNRIVGDLEQNVVPTMGFRTISLKHKSCNVKVYDLGGSPQIRSIWPRYYNDVHGLVYVVDASDTSRLTENRIILGDLISHENVSGKPLLLLANKQDLDGALDELDLVENLDVERVANEMRCPTRVETCSCFYAMTKSQKSTEGIINGYKWLLNTIMKNYQTLNSQVKSEPPIRNGFSVRSITSSPTPSKTESMNSDPFKPIHSLLKQNKLSGSSNCVKNGTNGKIIPLRRLLATCTNKTTPMPIEDRAEEPDLALQRTDCDSTIFQVAENNRQETVILNPLKLKPGVTNTRPFTAPDNFSRIKTEVTISTIQDQR